MGDLPRVVTYEEYRHFQRTGKWPESALGAISAGAIVGNAPKRHKYGVGPRHLRQLDGFTFDSIAERKRYEELRAREQAGEIVDLRVHPCWPIVVNDEPICEYQADFSYRLVVDPAITPPGPRYVEDVKGGKATRTRVYEIKKKLMYACHGIEIQEVET